MNQQNNILNTQAGDSTPTANNGTQNNMGIKKAALDFEKKLNNTKWIEAIRLQIAAQYLYDLLARHGTFIDTNAQDEEEVDYHSIYWIDRHGKAMSITSNAILLMLSDRYGIHILDSKQRKNTYELFKRIAYIKARKVQTSLTVYWDCSNKVLYKYAGKGKMYVLDGNTVTEEVNGYNNIYFLGNITPYKYLPNQSQLTLDSLFEGHFDEAIISRSEASLLLKYWFYSVFFSSELKARPIMHIYGPYRSGKTTLLKNLHKLIAGYDAKPTTMKQKPDDFYAHVANNDSCLFDNVDGKVSNEIMDAIAAITSSTVYSRRKLFTTNELYKSTINTSLAFTSQAVNFREDVVDRSILLKTERINETQEMFEVNSTNWNELQSALLDKLNQLVFSLRQSDSTLQKTKLRMYDFANWIYKVNSSDFYSIENIMTKMQKETNDGYSEIAELVASIIHKRKLSGFILFRELLKYINDENKAIGISLIDSTTNMNKKLNTQLDALKQHGYILKKEKKKEGWGWTIKATE